jgi:hypothetical protein
MLFIVPRRVLEREPLSEAHELAWHAYAVEYGLRLRRDGLRVCAVDVPLTHNSLSIGVEQLDASLAEIRRAYPEALPVRTPSRFLNHRPFPRGQGKVTERHGWRLRWLRESVSAHVGGRIVKGARCVLGDIRWRIDDLLDGGVDPLLIVNLDRERAFVEDDPDPLLLTRLGYTMHVTSGGPEQALAAIRAAPAMSSVLLSGLGVRDLRDVSPHLSGTRPLLGYRREVGYWLLVGPRVAHLAARLRSRRSTPAGMGRDTA